MKVTLDLITFSYYSKLCALLFMAGKESKMSKYAPLENFLEKSLKSEIPMMFGEIEKVIGGNLPDSSKKYHAWWSNESTTHVQAAAWQNAGYRTSQVDLESKKLVFLRVDNPGSAATKTNENPAENQPPQPYRHPVFGCMKGTVTIPDDVDLTEPADPDWARSIEEKYPQK